MINPDELVDNFVTKLKLVPAFVTAMGGSGNITAYVDSEAGLLDAIHGMTIPGCLVAWNELEELSEGYSSWVHRISVYVRYNSRIGAVLYQLTNGVPTSGSARFSAPDTVDNRFELLGIPTAVRAVDENDVEFVEVTFRYRQKIED